MAPRRNFTGSASERGRARVSAALGVLLAAAGLVTALFLWAPWAGAVDVHGIGFSKGCASPTNVGDPYSCTYSAQNSILIDTAGDTLTFTGLSDVVHALPSDVSSGNILSSLTVASIIGGATCNVSGSSTGAGATGNTLCTLPSNSSITFQPFSFYNTDGNDPVTLTDTATLTWQDTCSSGSQNCPVGDQHSTTGSQTTLQTLTPTPTNTPTSTPTSTSTPTDTPTNTPTSTSTPTDTPTKTPTPTDTPTNTPTATNTPAAGQGCSPGYWKNPQHFDSYAGGYTPSTQFSAVFDNAFPGKTLLQVLSTGGGGLNALGRHTVGALLNAAALGSNYPYTTGQVITRFNNVFPGTTSQYNTLANLFESKEDDNDGIVCPLD